MNISTARLDLGLTLTGIQTQVLQIDWKHLETPGKKPNFETHARKQRYRLLGKACRDLGIGSLLLAHHEDDQAETVLMRLMHGHRKNGLTGMESDAGFPECRGMYGIHESGGGQAELALFYPNNFLKNLPLPPQLSTESGGLRLHRPMLSFPKSRLIATCQAENMEWFEDATNKDPTLTARNAIRHIYNSHTMPAALSKPAILSLAGKARKESTKQQEIIDLYLSQCKILDFQTRSGLIRVQFPTLELPTALSQVEKEIIGAKIVRHILMLVTPLEKIPINSLSVTTKRLFPELYPDTNIKKQHAFSVAYVDIRHGKEDTCVQKPEYLISRAPYHRISCPSHTFLPSLKTAETQETPWSEWILFDGRYWIRIKNHTANPIKVRSFLPTDSRSFDGNLSPDSSTKLTHFSPVRTARLTLPCLVLQEGSSNEGDTDKKETVLAIPSFDVGIQDVEKFVEYEIKYKKIYWGALNRTMDEPRAVTEDIRDDTENSLLRDEEGEERKLNTDLGSEPAHPPKKPPRTRKKYKLPIRKLKVKLAGDEKGKKQRIRFIKELVIRQFNHGLPSEPQSPIPKEEEPLVRNIHTSFTPSRMKFRDIRYTVPAREKMLVRRLQSPFLKYVEMVRDVPAEPWEEKRVTGIRNVPFENLYRRLERADEERRRAKKKAAAREEKFRARRAAREEKVRAAEEEARRSGESLW